jgi:hypothetical protein
VYSSRGYGYKFGIVGLCILAAVCIGTMASVLLDNAVFFSQFIEHNDLAADYVLGVVWAFAWGLSILVWPVPPQHKGVLILLWFLRCAVALAIQLPIQFHYAQTGIVDALGYFIRAKQGWLADDLLGGDRTARLTALVWLHHRLLPNTYYATKISFTMAGHIAIYLFYRAIVLFLQRDDTRLLLILGLFPSIIFWSTGIGKDPIVLLGVGLYTYGTVGLYRRQGLRYLVYLALGIGIAMYIRPWMGFILCAPLVILLIMSVSGSGRKVALAVVCVIVMLITFNVFMRTFGLDSLEDTVTKVGHIAEKSAYGGSQRSIASISSLFDLLPSMPSGMFTVLFRPLLGEVFSPLGLLAGIEGTFLLILFLVAIWRSRLEELRDPVILWASSLTLLWAIFYALGASYNMGTIARYRLEILPILLCLLLYLARNRSKWRLADDQARSSHNRTRVAALQRTAHPLP